MRRLAYITFISILLLQTCALADVVVIVRREAQATGNYIRICDIARVEGPSRQAEEVGRTVIGPTPPRGRALKITRWDIEARLYEVGVDAKVVLAGNDSVNVLGEGSRPSRLYAEQAPLRELAPFAVDHEMPAAVAPSRPEPAANDRIEPEDESFGHVSAPPARKGTLAEQMQPNAQDRVGKTISHFIAAKYNRPDIEIETQLLTASAAIPYTAHLVEVDRALAGQAPGKATLQLRVKDNPEDQPRLVTVDAHTTVYGLAPVAAKQLSKDEIVVRGDLTVARVRMEAGKAYLPPREDALIGRKMKRNVKPGEPVLAVDTEVQAAVRQGEDVIHDTASAGWRVTGTGKALANGQIGDTIQVQDSATKKRFDARVTGPGTVEVIIKRKVWE
jgi:flagella basal body P-ring formation protein FlgA